MRINEDYIEILSDDDIANDEALSLNIAKNVEWLLNGHSTNIDFNRIERPIYKIRGRHKLRDLVQVCVETYGEDCNLNWIDVSGIRDFSDVFLSSPFNGDISKWDVSRAKNMT
jgi:hypothetical protein